MSVSTWADITIIGWGLGALLALIHIALERLRRK